MKRDQLIEVVRASGKDASTPDDILDKIVAAVSNPSVKWVARGDWTASVPGTEGFLACGCPATIAGFCTPTGPKDELDPRTWKAVEEFANSFDVFTLDPATYSGVIEVED